MGRWRRPKRTRRGGTGSGPDICNFEDAHTEEMDVVAHLIRRPHVQASSDPGARRELLRLIA
jgi:hypothetical protein